MKHVVLGLWCAMTLGGDDSGGPGGDNGGSREPETVGARGDGEGAERGGGLTGLFIAAGSRRALRGRE